jgi:hypothetical protein
VQQGHRQQHGHRHDVHSMPNVSMQRAPRAADTPEVCAAANKIGDLTPMSKIKHCLFTTKPQTDTAQHFIARISWPMIVMGEPSRTNTFPGGSWKRSLSSSVKMPYTSMLCWLWIATRKSPYDIW